MAKNKCERCRMSFLAGAVETVEFNVRRDGGGSTGVYDLCLDCWVTVQGAMMDTVHREVTKYARPSGPS